MMHSYIVDAEQPGGQYLRRLFACRELLLFLCWRDIIVRYKQTVLGFGWAVLRPLLMMLVFSFIFGRVARFAGDDSTPYALIVLSGLIAWQMFAASVQQGSDSLINNQAILTRVYFPRAVFPISSVGTPVIDGAVALVMFFAIMLIYDVPLTLSMLLAPFILAVAILLAIGVGLITSALNVFYRDFRHITPFALQLGLFASPVAYPLHKIPADWQIIFAINPMTGVIEALRWALISGYQPPAPIFVVSSLLWTVGLLVVGFFVFQHLERHFADRI